MGNSTATVSAGGAPSPQKKNTLYWLGFLIEHLEETAPAVLMAVMVALVSVDVFARYAFGKPIRGASELATLLFIWQVFLAGAAAVRRRMHIGIEFVVDRFPSRVRVLTDLLVNSAVFVMLLIVVGMGWGFALQSHFKQLQMLDLPYTLVNMAVPIGCALMSVHVLAHIIRTGKGIITGELSRSRRPAVEGIFQPDQSQIKGEKRG